MVYFVRKAHTQEIKLGTDSPLQVRDKVIGIATKVKARGIYKVRISDSPVFLTKLLGSSVNIHTQSDIDIFFCNAISERNKKHINSDTQ